MNESEYESEYVSIMDKDHNKLVVIMVGLPARGKSYISNKIRRYFTWTGYNTKMFNVGNYRRKFFKNSFNDHKFFDSRNDEPRKLREKLAMIVLDELIEWTSNTSGRTISIFDATNTTKVRRKALVDKLEEKCINYLFLESICTKKDIIEKNLQMKLHNDDYKNMDVKSALDDFRKRLQHYEKIYETIDEEECVSYMKIIDVQRSFNISKIDTHLKFEVCNFVMNININSGKIYLSRHGQSVDNVKETIGGNSKLTSNGRQYSTKLFTHIHNCGDNIDIIFTSTLKRTIETSKPFLKKYKVISKKLLDEVDAGICDGMTYKEIELIYPDITNKRKQDKLNFRYPYGESYRDIIDRIKHFILELERTDDTVLIITHTAVLRCILGYFIDENSENIPYMDVPLHKLFKLTPNRNKYKVDSILLKS